MSDDPNNGDGKKGQLTVATKSSKQIINATKTGKTVIDGWMKQDTGPSSDWVGAENSTEELDETESNGSTVEGTQLNRRECLAALGASLAIPGVVAQTAQADEQEDGYGTGEYGSGPYGDPVDDEDDDKSDEEEENVAVETNDATEVDDSSVILRGTLTELEGYDEATVYFEWGETGEGLSETTDEQTLESTGEFDSEVTSLESGTEYEFRAVVGPEGDLDTGDTLSFTTESEDEDEVLDADPQIVKLDAEDTSNSNNPHVDASIEWQATIDEGELDAAMLMISDSSGVIISQRNYSLSGQTAERSKTKRIHRGSGETYTVELTVYSAHETAEFERTTIQS